MNKPFEEKIDRIVEVGRDMLKTNESIKIPRACEEGECEHVVDKNRKPKGNVGL